MVQRGNSLSHFGSYFYKGMAWSEHTSVPTNIFKARSGGSLPQVYKLQGSMVTSTLLHSQCKVPSPTSETLRPLALCLLFLLYAPSDASVPLYEGICATPSRCSVKGR